LTGFDLVVEGRTFIDGELTYAEIGILDGRIAGIGKSLAGGDRRLDVGTSGIILPGFIDPHVHFRDPGLTEKEDFSTGTLSAVHGGVTCVLDMPNTKPPTIDRETLTAKKDRLRGRAHTDYGLLAAVTADCDIASMAPHAAGFKLFMGSTTGNILLNDDRAIAAAMAGIEKTGKRLSVHAEDDSLILGGCEGCTADHHRNRPVRAEHEAVRRLGRYRGKRINICHNTTAEGLDAASSYGFTTEVTLHHLLFDTVRHTGAEYKVNPPIRDPVTRERLWNAFVHGKASMFGSDHAPHTSSEKAEDFDIAPGGVPGVETTMPIVMDMVRRDIIPLKRAVSMGSENPAAAFGIRSKGRIAVGYDADLSVFDLRRHAGIDVKRLHSKCGHSPYGGMTAIFPDTVIIRGGIQVQDGEFCGDRIGEDIIGPVRS